MDNGKVPSNYGASYSSGGDSNLTREGVIDERTQRIKDLFSIAFNAHHDTRGITERIMGSFEDCAPDPVDEGVAPLSEPTSALLQMELALDGLERELRQAERYIDRLKTL